MDPHIKVDHLRRKTIYGATSRVAAPSVDRICPCLTPQTGIAATSGSEHFVMMTSTSVVTVICNLDPDSFSGRHPRTPETLSSPSRPEARARSPSVVPSDSRSFVSCFDVSKTWLMSPEAKGDFSPMHRKWSVFVGTRLSSRRSGQSKKVRARRREVERRAQSPCIHG